jgi:hypothetical protein
MSVRFGIHRFHHRYEFIKQSDRIMWTGSGFGMELHAECTLLARAQPFDTLIVQVDMRDGNSRRQTIRPHGKSMVMAGYLNLPCQQILYRLIPASVPKL